MKNTIKLALVLSVALSGPVYAQQACAPYVDVQQSLRDDYGEMPIGRGLANGVMIETWANLGTGSFTINIICPDGRACLLASGENWETVEPQPQGEPL